MGKQFLNYWMVENKIFTVLSGEAMEFALGLFQGEIHDGVQILEVEGSERSESEYIKFAYNGATWWTRLSGHVGEIHFSGEIHGEEVPNLVGIAVDRHCSAPEVVINLDHAGETFICRPRRRAECITLRLIHVDRRW